MSDTTTPVLACPRHCWMIGAPLPRVTWGQRYRCLDGAHTWSVGLPRQRRRRFKVAAFLTGFVCSVLLCGGLAAAVLLAVERGHVMGR